MQQDWPAIRHHSISLLRQGRPESLAVHCARPGSGSFAGMVQARQYLGGRQMLHVAISGRAAPVAVAILGAGNDAASSLLPGHPVWLCWKDDAAVVLDEWAMPVRPKQKGSAMNDASISLKPTKVSRAAAKAERRQQLLASTTDSIAASAAAARR